MKMATNFQMLKRTRRAPESGDVFAFQHKLFPDKYFFGRVAATDTRLGNLDGGVILIYVYRTSAPSKSSVPLLKVVDLLVPPIGTNKIPWTSGYFELVATGENGPQDLLSQHCFADGRGSFVDEYGVRLAEPIGPIGFYGLSGLLSIDNQITKALSALT